MRICLCSVYHFSNYQGGNERYTHELALALTKIKHQVIYLTGSRPSQTFPYPIITLPLYHLSHKPFPSLSWVLKPKINPVDIFHTTGSGLPLHFLAKNIKAPHIHTFQASNHPFNLLGEIGTQVEYNLIRANYQSLIVTSPYYQNRLPFPFPKDKVNFIPLPLPNYFFTHKLNIQRKNKLLLFVGTLDSHHYYKGLNILLQTLSFLPKDYILQIVGTGSNLPHYQDYCHKANLNSRVMFLGKVSDYLLLKAYHEAAIYIQPSTSDSEGFGLSVLEAMSAKTPVVITTASAGSSWLAGQQLVTTSPSNPKSLAQAIISKTTNHNKLMISQAYRFSRKLTAESTALKTLNLYQTLL